MGIIETKAIRRYQGSSLFTCVPSISRKDRVQNMGPGVVRRDAAPALFIDLSLVRVTVT